VNSSSTPSTLVRADAIVLLVHRKVSLTVASASPGLSRILFDSRGRRRPLDQTPPPVASPSIFYPTFYLPNFSPNLYLSAAPVSSLRPFATSSEMVSASHLLKCDWVALDYHTDEPFPFMDCHGSALRSCPTRRAFISADALAYGLLGGQRGPFPRPFMFSLPTGPAVDPTHFHHRIYLCRLNDLPIHAGRLASVVVYSPCAD